MKGNVIVCMSVMEKLTTDSLLSIYTLLCTEKVVCENLLDINHFTHINQSINIYIYIYINDS
jgi:hypothetical protein